MEKVENDGKLMERLREEKSPEEDCTYINATGGEDNYVTVAEPIDHVIAKLRRVKMSVMIKGMEMPETCDECRFKEGEFDTECYGRGIVCAVDGGSHEPRYKSNCKLVEIPTPHGRLIDADALLEANAYRTGKGILAINAAPTVIEAEGKE